MNSRTKGANGEREIARIYRDHGFKAVRTPLSGGMEWKGDLQGVPGVHVEVKRNERLNVWEALEQTHRDAARTDIPALHFRRNRTDWHVAIPIEDFIELIKLRDL